MGDAQFNVGWEPGMDVGGDPMIRDDVRAVLHRRLRADPSAWSVPGSLPVLYFGDLPAAQAVTVGLNPSDQEYLIRHGELLTGPAQRLADLPSLGLDARRELTDDECDQALARMRDYFDPGKPVYGSWFTSLSRVLTGFGLSFIRHQVAHLDLVQEPTTPTWSTLPTDDRAALLRHDLPFLTWQLRTFPVRTVICTSRTVSDHIRAALDVVVTTEDTLARLTWWAGHATVAERTLDVVG